MLKIKIKHIAFILLVLTWVSCDSVIYDDTEPNKDSVVYLNINTRAAHTMGEESINTDNVDFEDHVHNLAVLIFDTASGGKLGQYFTTNIASGTSTYVFTMEMVPGQRDFYFIANLAPSVLDPILAVNSRDEMDAQMKMFRELAAEQYLGAAQNNGFPMARVYLNQTIANGGTIYQPEPFKPVVNGVTEDYVKLIRTVAKVEVKFDSVDVDNVQKVELINANRSFSLTEVSMEPTSYMKNVEMKRLTTNNSWMAYMPAAYVSNTKLWNSAVGADNKPINFFRITDKLGNYYDIPIITHEGAIPGGQYLPFAKGTLADKPNYTLHQNHHYKYEIKNLPSQIEIIYSVSNWNMVLKETYMGYGYNVEVDSEGNVTITNTMQNCNPHEVRLLAVNGAYFGDNSANTTVLFNNLNDGFSQTYQINKDNVTTGAVYLEVYYNKTPGAGITPDKVFTK